jgi:CheY-like chemotaxis protein
MKMFGFWKSKPPEEVEDNQPEAPAFSSGDSDQISRADQNTGSHQIGQGKKILVVDDNPVVLKGFEIKMKALGFTVLTATEGTGAVNFVRQEVPDIIVMDINFPTETSPTALQWNGFTIMQWMRRFQEAKDIPVIIITGGDPEKYREKSLASGASAFFTKPINNAEFIMTVRRLLGQAKPAASATATVA